MASGSPHKINTPEIARWNSDWEVTKGLAILNRYSRRPKPLEGNGSW